jgi:hypothetical protein
MFAVRSISANLLKNHAKNLWWLGVLPLTGLPFVMNYVENKQKEEKNKNEEVEPSSHEQLGHPPSPGEKTSWKTAILETGAAITQIKSPLNAIHNHLCGFHFYPDDMKRQLEAHHFCSHLNEDFQQCAVFDTNEKDARLIGVEYVISERLFKNLPEEEKVFWHSHLHEVKSGELTAPRLPKTAEHALMSHLAPTYGKVFHAWHVDRDGNFDALPLGIPQVLMSSTKDGQIKQDLIDARDKKFGIKTSDKRKSREDIPDVSVDPSADAWEKGRLVQIHTTNVSHKSFKPQFA